MKADFLRRLVLKILSIKWRSSIRAHDHHLYYRSGNHICSFCRFWTLKDRDEVTLVVVFLIISLGESHLAVLNGLLKWRILTKARRWPFVVCNNLIGFSSAKLSSCSKQFSFVFAVNVMIFSTYCLHLFHTLVNLDIKFNL